MDNDAVGVVQFLATVYDKDLSREQAAAYVEALSDLPEETLKRAADELTRKQKWFPKIAELRSLAGQFSRTLTGGDAIVERLNHLYDQALDGAFEAEIWMKLIIQLRVSNREECADAWRTRYDHFTGAVTVDRKKYATDWGTMP